MAAASKDELKPLRLLGRSGFNATGVKPTFFRIGVRKSRRADIDALAGFLRVQRRLMALLTTPSDASGRAEKL